ncbi:MAG: LemA family protein [Planctomycetes bacterium]|nr:LemA family protein [Planctomycetota bacterium]
MPTDPLLPAVAIAAVAMFVGWLCVRAMARQDHRTWVLARAPALPVSALAVGDDAWVRGTVAAPTPLRCPHFGTACVAFDYARQREHHWTTKDKQGRTQHHSEWRTEHGQAAAIDFELDDGARIVVRAARATNEALQRLRTDYETSRLRHVASVLEVGATVSVLGVVQDDRSLDAEREVPCLWTRLPREQRVRRSARSEAWLFFGAGFVPLLGGVGAVLWHRAHAGGSPLAPVDWAWAGAGGVALWLPFWGLGTWNRLVRLRQQVPAAHRQVDVDLAVRAALVPNLTAVVRAGAAHETALLQALAGVRSGRDEGAEHAVHDVLVLHERHPELRADALYRDLHERLWAIEEKLAHTRQLHNDIATEWNDRIARFPASLVARSMGCRPAPLFAGDDQPLPPRLLA